MGTDRTMLRSVLKGGVSLGALLLLAGPALADEAAPGAPATPVAAAAPAPAPAPPSAAAEVTETNRYALRMMLQAYDGVRDLSHSQLLGFARMRKGDQSFTQFDFGDGAVVINRDGKLAAGRFLNLTPTEYGILYDYRTKRIAGDSEIARFHNTHVRPWLDKAPPLGADARWRQRLPLSALGIGGLAGGDVTVELSREYFTHEGKPLVLIHYAVPAFGYDAGSGRTVVQWGRGLSLTDPGFGTIYLNATLHRAVMRMPGFSDVPYRFARTMVAADPDGSAMIDYRRVPQLQRHVGAFFDKEAMTVVPPRQGPGFSDPRPLTLARNLDVIAFGIGEDGANDVPATAIAQTMQNRGRETTQSTDQTLSNLSVLNSTAGNLYNWGRIAEGSAQEQAVFLEISGAMQTFQAKSTATSQAFDAAVKRLNRLESQIHAMGAWEPTEALTALERNMAATGTKLDQAAARLEVTLESFGLDNKMLSSEQKKLIRDTAVAEYRQAKVERELSILAFEEAAKLESSYTYSIKAKDMAIFDQLQAAQNDVVDLARAMKVQEAEGLKIAMEIKNLPPSRFQKFKAGLGTTLQVLSDGFNAYTTGKSLANLQKQASQNLAYGDAPALTRGYGSSMSGDLSGYTFTGLLDIGLGFDLIALASKDPMGAAAVATSAISDLFIAGKALKDINVVNTEAAKEATRLARAQKEQYIAKSDRLDRAFKAGLAALDAEIAKLDGYSDQADRALEARMAERGLETHILNDPNWTDSRIDPKTGLPTPGYWQYLKDNHPGTLASFGIDPEAPVGGWPDGVGTEYRPGTGTAAEAGPTDAELRAGLAKEIEKKDYPTAPPRDPDAGKRETARRDEKAAEPPPPPSPEEVVEKRKQDAQDALDAYQKKKLDERKEAEAQREAERQERNADHRFRTTTLEVSELLVSQFDLDPVTFTPPEFDPPKWEPPVWVPPEFDPPDISRFPPTDPKDLDGYPGTGEYPAFTFDSMSGTVETSLDRWADWLATQDVDQLTKLALQAGYPNLASALADAENIIRLSQDKGYRQWANTAPSCGGYVGCGPAYLGRWAMKRSIVALGDILAQSREVFSTGGFTDIGISGFNLSYLLRDHSLEDGDLINVEITQFGRVVARVPAHSLTNAGNRFGAQLRPGVAQMVVTALNEGSSPPNTAQVAIDNVVRGVGNQSYSLQTGQTAVLRIEAGAQ